MMNVCDTKPILIGRTISAKHVRQALATLGAAGCLLAPMHQAYAAAIYNDTYTLKTSNQSMWYPGSRSQYSASTGFQGAAWGTYAGNAPVSGGIYAVSGSENAEIFPIGCGDWKLSACYADTRTGAAVSLASSGRVGVDVYASAEGGSLSVVLPVTTQMTIGEKANGVTSLRGAVQNPFFPTSIDKSFAAVDGVFRVSGSSSVLNGAAITTTAPTFSAGVNAIVNMDNSIVASGCFIFSGCSDTGFNANANPGTFNLVGIDSAQQKPVSVLGGAFSPITLGKEYTIRSGEAPCVTSTDCIVKVGAPTLAVIEANGLQNVSGGTLSGNELNLSANSPMLRLTADLTGIAQSVLGLPVDVLNPNINVGVGSVSGSLFDAQIGVQLGLAQSFSLNPAMEVTLAFDKPVSQWVPQASLYLFDRVIATVSGTLGGYQETTFYDDLGRLLGTSSKPYGIMDYMQSCWIFGCYLDDTSHWEQMGTNVAVNLSMGADLMFDGNADGHLLSRTYGVSDSMANFSSQTSLTVDGILPMRAGCFNVELKLGLGSTGQQCAYDHDFDLGGLADLSLIGGLFSLGGFDAMTFASELPQGEAPEPGTVWLFLLAACILVAIHKRHSATAFAPA